MIRVLSSVLLAILLVPAQTYAEKYPSNDEGLDALSARIAELNKCIERYAEARSSSDADLGLVIAKAIADSPSSTEQLIEDARALSSKVGQANVLDEMSDDEFLRVQFAIGTLMAIAGNRDGDPWIKYGAMTSFLIAAASASEGDCKVPVEIEFARRSEIDAASSTKEAVTFSGARVDKSDYENCSSYDLRANALANNRYETNGSTLSHAEFVALLSDMRDENPSFDCVEIQSSETEIDVRRVLLFQGMGLNVTWTKAQAATDGSNAE